MLSSGFWALEGFIHFQRMFQLHSCFIGMCNCSSCRQDLLSFPLAHSHKESTVSVTEQVITSNTKTVHFQHLNLVLHCHLGTISGGHYGSMPLYWLHLSFYPQLLGLLRFTPARLSGQQHQINLNGTLPPSTSLTLCLLPASPRWWNHMLCAFTRKNLCGWVKTRLSWDQSCLVFNQSTHGYIHPYRASQQGPIQATYDYYWWWIGPGFAQLSLHTGMKSPLFCKFLFPEMPREWFFPTIQSPELLL